MAAQGRPFPSLGELIAGSSAAHQRAVAAALELDREASGSEIVATLLDSKVQQGIIDELSEEALEQLAACVLGTTAGIPDRIEAPGYHGPHATAEEILELERHGLAFAFGSNYMACHVVPAELAMPLARLVAPHLHSDPIPRADPKKIASIVANPLGVVHDAAALAGFLATDPLRVKQDGELFAREEPKLNGALPDIAQGLAPEVLADIEPGRISMAMDWLGEVGALELRDATLPGQTPHRVLAPIAAIEQIFADPPEELRASAEPLAGGSIETVARALTAEVDPEEWLTLDGLLEAIAAVCDEAALPVEPPAPNATESWSMLDLLALWIIGEIELGVDQDGAPIAVRFSNPAPQAPATSAGPLAIVQADFDVIVLRTPTPSERLLLNLCCEPVGGQAHVFRISNDRSETAATYLANGVIPTLKSLVGELPQNVERTVESWVTGFQPPIRLRTAMMIEIPPHLTEADFPKGLDHYVIERLGPNHLAIRSDDLKEVEAILDRAGFDLAPGLNRISGHWRERDEWQQGRDSPWTQPIERPSGPSGHQVSKLGSGSSAAEPSRTFGS